jgi:hypothetical protein
MAMRTHGWISGSDLIVKTKGGSQQGLFVPVLLGLSGQHSFLLGMEKEPLE